VAPQGSTEKTDRTFRFGPFELSEREGELRKSGVRIKLQEQPFRVLVELIANPGNLVSREDLHKKLWPSDTFVDFDVGLNSAIRKLRQALSDDAENPRYIETLAKRGYRFVAPVTGAAAENSERLDQPVSDVGANTEGLAHSHGEPATRAKTAAILMQQWILVVVLAAMALGLVVWQNRSRRIPTVEAVTQLTDDGQPKYPFLVTDGSRIYFTEGTYPIFRIAQVAIGGGLLGPISTTLRVPRVLGVAQNGSKLLIKSINDPLTTAAPLWQLPLPAGSARPLGNIQADDGSYTPDGRVLFAQNGDLFVAEGDGSSPRKLVSGMPGPVRDPSMSPDGSRIAFMVDSTPTTQTGLGVTLPAIFEANADGSGVHVLVPGKTDEWVARGTWTPDSKYLVFTRGNNRKFDVWAIPLKKQWFSGSRQPIQLTNGPLAYGASTVTPDGRQILVLGVKERGEVVHYDEATKQFVPLPSFLGISALDPTFSSDGEWVAYVSMPDHSLWRSRSNGTERLQLTYPPEQVIYPFISPDGRQVTYQSSRTLGGYIISMDGGAPKKVVDFNTSPLTWSPDSNRLVFNDYRAGGAQAKINVLDLRTGQISLLPGNQLGPMWIGPNKLIAARSTLKSFQIFDFATQNWSDLPNPEQELLQDWAQSPDLRYFYYTTGGQIPKVIRVHVADLKSEVVTTLKDLPRAQDAAGGTTISIAPDGSPIFTRNIGTQEIYALTVKWP
jgi:DNA-binding winged helix-turn-helix (wHTH) protein/Tol biopolymer transport system component